MCDARAEQIFLPSNMLDQPAKFKYVIFVTKNQLDYFSDTSEYFQPTFRFSHDYSGLVSFNKKMSIRLAKDLAAIRIRYTFAAVFQYHVNIV